MRIFYLVLPYVLWHLYDFLAISSHSFRYLFAHPLESYPDEPSSFHLPEQFHFLRGDKSFRLPVNRHAGREIELLAYFSDCFCIPGSPDDGEVDGGVILHAC